MVFTNDIDVANILESIVSFGFENVKMIYKTKFSVVIAQGSFADLIVCLTETAKNNRFQRISFQALDALKATIPNMLACPECPLSAKYSPKDRPQVPKQPPEDPMIKFWYPILFAFHDVIMTGDDLEVRQRALDILFGTLETYGGSYSSDFWDIVCRKILFPIFNILRARPDDSRFNDEELSVWLSTTMIKALRGLIELFTHYFQTLERMLDLLLDLLVSCICQGYISVSPFLISRERHFGQDRKFMSATANPRERKKSSTETLEENLSHIRSAFRDDHRI